MTKARDISKLLSTANGKIAGENLDVSFENITDTGTEGTRVATGTTAQRGSTAGQLRFNSTTGLAEYYTGTAFKTIDTPPTISSLDVTEVDSQAGGNQTIVITGNNFQSGAIVTFVGASGTDFNASTVTVDSVTQITAVSPKASFLNAQEPYGVKVSNTNGLSGTLSNQINVDSSPSWNTSSGTIATIQDEATGTHATVSATDPDGDTVSYSETTSVLSGAGLTLNSSTGAITGDPTDVASDTTYNFTLRATANSKTADRNFTIVVQPTPIATGGTVTTSGSYTYHTFLSTGSFVLGSTAKTIEYLMVAGGGGGGYYAGAGGGAGGLIQSSFSGTTNTTYTITVGNGGAGIPTSNGNSVNYGVNGQNSQIAGSGLSTIIAYGGGGGAGGLGTNREGRDGGSGGGGCSYGTGDYGGGSGVAGQGNDGGYQANAGGGGGGAGSAASGVNGGTGLQYSTWATATSTGDNGYYASGGSGYPNGTSSDGGGGDYSTNTNALANTGGGGRGDGETVGGAGGSGIIIVRYTT